MSRLRSEFAPREMRTDKVSERAIVWLELLGQPLAGRFTHGCTTSLPEGIALVHEGAGTPRREAEEPKDLRVGWAGIREELFALDEEEVLARKPFEPSPELLRVPAPSHIREMVERPGEEIWILL